MMSRYAMTGYMHVFLQLKEKNLKDPFFAIIIVNELGFQPIDPALELNRTCLVCCWVQSIFK